MGPTWVLLLDFVPLTYGDQLQLERAEGVEESRQRGEFRVKKKNKKLLQV